jgi:hypothetical protein
MQARVLSGAAAGCSGRPDCIQSTDKQKCLFDHAHLRKSYFKFDNQYITKLRDVRGRGSSSGAMAWQTGERNGSSGNDNSGNDKRSWGITAMQRGEGPTFQSQSSNTKTLPINVDLLLVHA